jgi:diguanylate cyclase (GGDEF)-like protein
MLGTPAEERFDKITRLARRMFGVSMSVIDLAGERRAWLKSVQGFDRFEVDRANSYCHQAIAGSDSVCVITDARTDPRLKGNPYVDAFVFYAGVPLTFEGEKVGVMCICDSKPRDMTPEELDALRDLASLAEHELAVCALSEAQISLARENDELETASLVDVLTRVWNRGAIMQIAARELQNTVIAKAPTSILMLDIDHFKHVNDKFTHQGGDEVLRQVGSRLRATTRPTDAVGRYGGEEFMVVLPGTNAVDAERAAERIRLAVMAEPVPLNGVAVPVTCSVGCTTSRAGGEFVETLVRAADEALYRAKELGRNRVVSRAVTPSILVRAAKPESG